MTVSRCVPELLARACHEVRNSLSALKLNLSLIESQGRATDRHEAMQRSLQELELIDEAIHTLVRLDLGRLEPRLRPTAIAALISSDFRSAYAPGIRVILQKVGESRNEVSHVNTDIRLAQLAIAIVLRQLRSLAPNDTIDVTLEERVPRTAFRFVLRATEIRDEERDEMIAGSDLNGGLGLGIALHLMQDIDGRLIVGQIPPNGTCVRLEFPTADTTSFP